MTRPTEAEEAGHCTGVWNTMPAEQPAQLEPTKTVCRSWVETSED